MTRIQDAVIILRAAGETVVPRATTKIGLKTKRSRRTLTLVSAAKKPNALVQTARVLMNLQKMSDSRNSRS